jgi:branched-chain amino acid transport system ATP-binding protein
MTTATPAPLLVTDGVSKRFGGVTAVRNISIEISPREIRAIIGPNGSGKSTFINVLSGIYRPTAGRVIFRGHNVEGLQPHAITRRGMSRTFQNLRLFRDLSVLDNVMLGYQWKVPGGLWGTIARTRRNRTLEEQIEEEAVRACGKMGIAFSTDAIAGTLSYGQQRRVEIARALAGGPTLLLLDEPVAGMNAAEALELGQELRRLRDEGITILLIEHNMRFVMNLADRITVFDHGERIFEGRPDEVQRDQRVIDAYLGKANGASRN